MHACGSPLLCLLLARAGKGTVWEAGPPRAVVPWGAIGSGLGERKGGLGPHACLGAEKAKQMGTRRQTKREGDSRLLEGSAAPVLPLL